MKLSAVIVETKCVVVDYKTVYASQNDRKKIFFLKFPSDVDKQELWVSALPNILITFVIKTYRDIYVPYTGLKESNRRRAWRSQTPKCATFSFNVPSSLFRKTTPAKSRSVQDCKLGIESRAEKQKRALAEKDKFKVDRFKKGLIIPLRDILRSFSHQLETFSEIEAIVKKAEESPLI